MIVPTRRWFGVALVLAGLPLLVLIAPSAGLVWWVAIGLWVGAALVDAIRVAGIDLERLTLERDGPPALSIGRPLGVRYRWRYPDDRLTLWIRESLPREVTSPDPSDRRLELTSDRDRVEERTLVPIARGKLTSWRFDLRIAGPWGLVWRQQTRVMPWAITIYPRLREVALQLLPSQSRIRRDVGQRQVRRIGEGRLFESLREWVPGDELRTVDWKATARRGKLIARQYEDERRQRVLLVLDAGRLLTAETAGRARLEDAIEAIAQLASRAVGLDDDIGLLVFTDQIDHFVPPARGRRALRAVLDALAAVEGKLVEPNYPLAFGFLAAQARRRALTVLFTDVIDRFASEALVGQIGGLRPRHLPVAVTIRDLTLETIAAARADTAPAAFKRAAAEQLLAVRADALAEIRARGAVVVDAHPEATAKAVVECYLQLKRRAMI